MTVLTILTSAILIILIFIQMHNSMRIEDRRQELEELMDKSNNVISKFESVFGEMTDENEKYSSLITRIAELNETNEYLMRKSNAYESLIKTQQELHSGLIDANKDLEEIRSLLKTDISNKENEVKLLDQRITYLTDIKVRLEIAVDTINADEDANLLLPIEVLGLKQHSIIGLHEKNYYGIGELVKADEQTLLKVRGVGKTTIEKIKSGLKEFNFSLGMNVTCIDGRWYLLNTEKIEQ